MNLFNNLLFRIFLSILVGIVVGLYAPLWLNRTFVTFNKLFGSFLGFSIPLIIMGLVMPAIAELGKNAGKLLFVTIVIAYSFTIFSGFSTYFVGSALFPAIIGEQASVTSAQAAERSLEAFFTINIPPILDVMSALVLAFMIGVSLSLKSNSTLGEVLKDFRDIITLVIGKVIIPLLPFYIMSIFSEIAYGGKVVSVISVFFKIIGIIFVMHIALLILQFILAGLISGKSPMRSLLKMMPAYATALGTQSSAATIPVTLRQVIKMGVPERIAGFVVPLCATIHLSGSTMKITACAMALMLMSGQIVDFESFSRLIFMLGIMMVAAPGVPGGAIMAALGILQSMLGFDAQQQALMIALYIAMDSFGTACNVTGDGAVALIVNKISTLSGRE
ncbi:dicarboxylate/amino acid:cation symporter [Capnocytophaga felis]|uniref:Sodium:proton antiporter n=1 Tax=Capnocytophaga felis TaxID=2267611 RepID=A0A5M4B8P6_9FLAO|nr:dicarboxylate/amino acid:cation symporter [Capnocytophaga felis]GET45983.1 sodium:proton antiporter [Capnocytophaga felis]GET49165.1 sodium:proton antiporter [Capnocytophaga felis]